MLSCHCWLENLKVGQQVGERAEGRGHPVPGTMHSVVPGDLPEASMEKAERGPGGRKARSLVFSNLFSGRTSSEPQSVGLPRPRVPPSPRWLKFGHQDSGQSCLIQGHAYSCAEVLVLCHQSQAVSCSNPDSKSYGEGKFRRSELLD